jgi:deazaflavin-dependent oxidoreductase (nitroreductase family)
MSTQRRRMNIFQRAQENFARSAAGYWYLKRIAPRIDAPLLRLTGGRVSSMYPAPIMLLTTTGAKSGQPRSIPLTYLADGDEIILVGSNYGGKSHPAWYRNLLANPKAEVLAGERSGSYTASQITDPGERERTWARVVDLYAGYGDYEKRAGDRTIPLVRLERITA